MYVCIQFPDPGIPLVTLFVPYDSIRFIELSESHNPSNILDLFFKDPDIMFRQVPENVNIRPVLKREDFSLIRRAFIKTDY